MENPTYEDYVNNDKTTVGCGSPYAYLFFIFYIYIVSLILLNLFIAVTLQGFNEVQRKVRFRITDDQLLKFTEVWKELDNDGTGFIHISEAGNLLRNLINKKCDLFPPRAKILMYDSILLSQFIENLNLRLYKKF